MKKYEKLETIISKSSSIAEIMEIAMKKKNGKYHVFCQNREDLKEKMEHAQEIFGKVNKKIKIQEREKRNNSGFEPIGD